MEQWLIYKHTSMKSGKSYIGLTKNTMESRWKEHIIASKTNKANNHFYNAITLYGIINWYHEVLVENIDTYEEAQVLEKYYIKLYDTFENGYNSTIGGEGVNGYKYTEEEKDKMSEERRNRKGNILYTFYNPTLRILEENIHTMDLAKKYNILPGNLWYVVNGKSLQAEGWFLFKGYNYEYTSVPMYDFEHEDYGVVRSSITDLASIYNLHPRSLRRVQAGERIHHKGWTLPGNQHLITFKSRKDKSTNKGEK